LLNCPEQPAELSHFHFDPQECEPAVTASCRNKTEKPSHLFHVCQKAHENAQNYILRKFGITLENAYFQTTDAIAVKFCTTKKTTKYCMWLARARVQQYANRHSDQSCMPQKLLPVKQQHGGLLDIW